jgi:hypothetical protein
MRLVSAFLFVALTGSFVLADEAKPADPKPSVTKKKVPYRVVKMLPETGQVLLFDRQHGNHVVAEAGQTLDGYTIDAIDDDEVTLIAENGASVILTAPPPPRQPRRPTATKEQPVDPYADGSEAKTASKDAGESASTAPVDPYAEPEAPKAPGEGGVRVASAAAPSTATGAPTAAPIVEAGPPSIASATPSVESDEPSVGPSAPIIDPGPSAPSDPYGDPGIAAFADAVGAAPPAGSTAAPKPAKPAKPTKNGKKPAKATGSADAASALASAATGRAESAAPAETAKPAAAADAKAGGAVDAKAGATVVARAELDAALADFAKTAGTFRAAFTPDGLRFDSVAEGSLLAKVGLRKGDIVTYVDGKPLRSLDDAASLYARAGSMRGTTIQVAREGKNVSLRVAIQ